MSVARVALMCPDLLFGSNVLGALNAAIGAARLVNNNPRKLDVDALKAITRAAFTGDRSTLAS